jgi:hypothetical protein
MMRSDDARALVSRGPRGAHVGEHTRELSGRSRYQIEYATDEAVKPYTAS